jgi:rhodanese-related sulfurtransferase
MKRYVTLISVVLLLTLMFTSCARATSTTSQEPITYPPPESGTYVDLTAGQAKALVENESNLMIIDVSSNYDKGHLPGAVNYFLADGSLDRAIPTLDTMTTYLVYANIGSSGGSIAYVGAQRLVDAGFTKVYRLDGEYRAWVEAGYPVEE